MNMILNGLGTMLNSKSVDCVNEHDPQWARHNAEQ